LAQNTFSEELLLPSRTKERYSFDRRKKKKQSQVQEKSSRCGTNIGKAILRDPYGE
jgi:hypothetical protein